MASSYSTSLKIQLMGNGEDSGVWGSISNTNWNLMEQAVSGVQTITMANANYTLTNLNGVSDEARNMVLVVQGTNSAIYQVIIPLNQPKMYVVSNQTTGGYAITIGSSTGAIITIPNGVTAQVYTDGTNTYSAQTGSAGNFTVNGTLTSTGLTDTGNMTVGGTLGVTGATSLNGGGTSTTPVSSDNSNNIATTAFVKNVTGTLGTMSTQNSNNVNITGGTITGSYGLTAANATNSITAVNVSGTVAAANGGTGLTSPGASGNLLVSNGTAWTSATLASSGIKLGLGITGEVWNNVTGSRSANTPYTNSRSYPIMVTISMHTGSSGSNPSYIYVDGIVVNQSSSGGWTGGTDFTCTTIVPPGKTYSTNSTAAGALWVELY